MGEVFVDEFNVGIVEFVDGVVGEDVLLVVVGFVVVGVVEGVGGGVGDDGVE